MFIVDSFCRDKDHQFTLNEINNFLRKANISIMTKQLLSNLDNRIFFFINKNCYNCKNALKDINLKNKTINK